jgi:hypothetical protein
MTTLGVEIALDGNMKQQVRVLLKKLTLWAEQMGSSELSKYEGWLTLTSTIWNTLCYPLPATCIP